jgi:hypothetical protein
MLILGELEYLKSLVKLALKKKDDSLKSSNLIKLEKMPTINKICINKTLKPNTTYVSRSQQSFG